MTGVIQMQPCTFSEAFDLLKVCEEEQVKCAVEVNTGGYLDHLVTVADEVPKVEYEQLNDGDCMTVDMGNTQFSFEVTGQFAKDVRGQQITVAISKEHYTVWFSSGRVSRTGINKVKWFIKPPSDDE